MAKYFDKIGFGETTETEPGIYIPQITEREVYGDVFKNISANQSVDKTNSDISIDMKISFIADPFAVTNFTLIKYAEYLGTKWKVTSVEPQFPRLVLTLGGKWNE